VQTNKTGVNTHVQARKTNLFNSWKCEIKFNHNRLRKSQAKRSVIMGTPNITTTPHFFYVRKGCTGTGACTTFPYINFL